MVPRTDLRSIDKLSLRDTLGGVHRLAWRAKMRSRTKRDVNIWDRTQKKTSFRIHRMGRWVCQRLRSLCGLYSLHVLHVLHVLCVLCVWRRASVLLSGFEFGIQTGQRSASLSYPAAARAPTAQLRPCDRPVSPWAVREFAMGRDSSQGARSGVLLVWYA